MPKLSTVLAKDLIDPLVKGTTLRRMGLLSKDPKIMRDALTALENGGASSLLELGLAHGYAGNTEQEIEHIRDDFLDSEAGWFKDLGNIAPVLRLGLIQAGHLALQYRLPVDSYCVTKGDVFEIAIAKSERQITMLIMFPRPATGSPEPLPDLEDIWFVQGDGKDGAVVRQARTRRQPS